jgi:hypothetical protein
MERLNYPPAPLVERRAKSLKIMSIKRDGPVNDPLQGQSLVAPGRYMNIAATFVRCVKCGTDFRSILTFKTLYDFERAARVGFVAQCSNCYAIFDCNRSNMYCELAQPDSSSSARPVVSIPARNKPEQD